MAVHPASLLLAPVLHYSLIAYQALHFLLSTFHFFFFLFTSSPFDISLHARLQNIHESMVEHWPCFAETG
jgi:hypothetical protein